MPMGGYVLKEDTINKQAKASESSEIDRLTCEFIEAGGSVEPCQKQYTRAEYLIKMAEDKDNGVKEGAATYSNTRISYGSF